MCERQWSAALVVKQWGTCPAPVRQVYVCDRVEVSVTLSTAIIEERSNVEDVIPSLEIVSSDIEQICECGHLNCYQWLFSLCSHLKE